MGIFEIGEEHNKIRLEKEGRESKIMFNVAHDTKDDVGWNPRCPIFHDWRGSYKEHEEHEGETLGEKSLKPTRFDYTCARSSKHKEIHDPNPTKDDT